MNQDEVSSLVRKLLITMLSAAATKFHLDAQTALEAATAIADLVVIAWGTWVHWNMKKVPENAVVVSPKITTERIK